jgi:hypothetical protein
VQISSTSKTCDKSDLCKGNCSRKATVLLYEDLTLVKKETFVDLMSKVLWNLRLEEDRVTPHCGNHDPDLRVYSGAYIGILEWLTTYG